MTNTSPNIFNYATSELSQDAFICWALEYANKEGSELHNFGQDLLTALIARYNEKLKLQGFNSLMLAGENGKQDNTNKKYKKIPDSLNIKNIAQQEYALDITAYLSDGYVLLIEDKTNTSNHGNQLLRYKKSYVDNKYSEEKQIRIYFKTGYQFSFDDVNKKGWAEFTRGDLLKIMDKHKNIENQIFIDAYNYHLSEQEKFEQSCYYQLEKIAQKIGKENVNWIGWAANPNGGETMLTWHVKTDASCVLEKNENGQKNKIDSCHLNFILKTAVDWTEENKFSYKITLTIGVFDNNISYGDIRNHLFHCLREKDSGIWKLKINDDLEFDKPSRFGSGKHMALFVHERKNADIETMANLIKTAHKELTSIIEQASDESDNNYHFVRDLS